MRSRNYKYKLPSIALQSQSVDDTWKHHMLLLLSIYLISLDHIDKSTKFTRILKAFLAVVVNLGIFFWMVEIPHQCCGRRGLGIEWLCPHQGASRLRDVGRCAKQGWQEGRQWRATATHWYHERLARWEGFAASTFWCPRNEVIVHWIIGRYVDGWYWLGSWVRLVIVYFVYEHFFL